jgi:hypothetical protein
MPTKRHTCRSCSAVQPIQNDAEIFTCSFCGEQERLREVIPEAIPVAQPVRPPQMPAAKPVPQKPQTTAALGCVSSIFGGCFVVSAMIGLLIFGIVLVIYRSFESLDEIIKENERKTVQTQTLLYEVIDGVEKRIDDLQRWPTEVELANMIGKYRDSWGHPLAVEIEDSGMLVITSRGIDETTGSIDDLTADTELKLHADVFWDEADSG